MLYIRLDFCFYLDVVVISDYRKAIYTAGEIFRSTGLLNYIIVNKHVFG